VMVVNGSGVCIEGATVQVTSGPSAGPPVEQDSECSAWSYGGGGVELRNLVPGVSVTVRATTPDGRMQEKALMPLAGTYSATMFTP
jgi:hypothetical protein